MASAGIDFFFVDCDVMYCCVYSGIAAVLHQLYISKFVVLFDTNIRGTALNNQNAKILYFVRIHDLCKNLSSYSTCGKASNV